MMPDTTHNDLMEKLVEHEGKFIQLNDTVMKIEQKIDPIVTSLRSIAWAFKGLLVLGSGSAAVLGILALMDHLQA
jgi:hypothetical protein